MFKNELFGKLLILFAAFVSIFHIFIAIYLINDKDKNRVFEKESQELSALTGLLNTYIQLEATKIYTNVFISSSSEQQIAIMHKAFTPIMEGVSAAHPELSLGFYSTTLDTFICYAPEKKYSNYNGVSLTNNKDLENIYISAQPQVIISDGLVGKLVISREPVIYQNKIIGHVFAHKNLQAVEQGLSPLASKSIYLEILGLIGILLLLIIWYFIYERQIRSLKVGLKNLSNTVAINTPNFQGQLGEIIPLINELSKSLIRSRFFLEQLLESIDMPIVVKLVKNKNVICNSKAKQLLPEEMNYSNNTESPMYYLQQTLYTGSTITNLELAASVENKMSYYLINTFLIEFNEEVEAAVLTAKNINESKTAELDIRKKEKLRWTSELLNGANFETTNVLTSVMTLVQMLAINFSENSLEKQHIKAVMQDINRIKLLLKEVDLLLEYNEPEMELTNIISIIKESLILMSDRINIQNIEVNEVYTDEIPKMRVDKQQIRTVLINLFQNALDAMPNGGTLILQTGYDNQTKTIRIVIADSGEGISSKSMDLIYKPFYTTKDQAVGLGLTVSYYLLKNHNGKLLLESELGVGSKFTVLLPVEGLC